MPDTNNKPNDLAQAPKTSDKLAAMGTLALTNGPVLAAPLLSSIDPHLNSQGAGGVAVTMIGNGVLVFVQAFAAQNWFDDYKYGVWVCIGLSLAICLGLYVFALGNVELGILNSLGAMATAASGYGPFNKLGVYSRPGDKPPPPEPPPPAPNVDVANVDKMEVS